MPIFFNGHFAGTQVCQIYKKDAQYMQTIYGYLKLFVAVVFCCRRFRVAPGTLWYPIYTLATFSTEKVFSMPNSTNSWLAPWAKTAMPEWKCEWRPFELRSSSGPPGRGRSSVRRVVEFVSWRHWSRSVSASLSPSFLQQKNIIFFFNTCKNQQLLGKYEES